MIMDTSNQLFQNYDTSKIFVWNNRYQEESITNSSYDVGTLEAGTVMARYIGTDMLIPFDSTDIKSMPIGILTQSVTIQGGETVNVNICVAGDVVAPKLVFVNGTDTLNTLMVNGELVRDAIQGDAVGIKLVGSTELTNFDNQ